jgi:DNA mismatch repair protein MutS
VDTKRMLENIAQMLCSKERLLTEIYFDLQLFFEEKYGKNTIRHLAKLK